MELIDKYKAFNRGTYPNVMICVAASPEYPFTEKEHHLLQHIMEQCPGKKGYLVKNDDKVVGIITMEDVLEELVGKIAEPNQGRSDK